MSSKAFNPDTDMPDLSGKVAVVTGGTAGLGTETVRQLAKHNARVFFTGRNSAAAESVISSIKDAAPTSDVTFIECDLASLASVQEAARQISSATPRLDLLFCNAGIMAHPMGLTKDGYEIQFGTNHLGHALLVKLLLPTLLRTADEQPDADVRVVFNTSLGHKLACAIRYDDLRTEQDMGFLGPFKRYGQSKLANVLYAAELARRHSNITAASVHPGVINTGLISGLGTFNRYFTNVTTVGQQVTVEEGVKNQLWAATAGKEGIVSGEYYEPVGKPGGHTKASQDPKLAAELWEWTEKELARYSI